MRPRCVAWTRQIPAGGARLAALRGLSGRPRAQPRSGNPRLPCNLTQRPAAASQQPHRLPLEFIRVLTTCRTHQTPSCSIRSLSEVCTISREGHRGALLRRHSQNSLANSRARLGRNSAGERRHYLANRHQRPYGNSQCDRHRARACPNSSGQFRAANDRE